MHTLTIFHAKILDKNRHQQLYGSTLRIQPTGFQLNVQNESVLFQ